MVNFVIIILRRTFPIFSGIEQTLVQCDIIYNSLKSGAFDESSLEKSDTVPS
jgi:hypothetical protein